VQRKDTVNSVAAKGLKQRFFFVLNPVTEHSPLTCHFAAVVFEFRKYGMMIMRFNIAAAALALTALTHMAQAEAIIVESDKTQLLTVSTKPGTVVVGNPTIADVSINGNQIFVHGRGYGNTNIIILDEVGSQIANLNVSVRQAETNAVSLYRGSGTAVRRLSYSCGTFCETSLQVGDDSTAFANALQQMGNKGSLASGSQPAEAAAPAAAQ
jgi:Pilus formation protein N terminal region